VVPPDAAEACCTKAGPRLLPDLQLRRAVFKLKEELRLAPALPGSLSPTISYHRGKGLFLFKDKLLSSFREHDYYQPAELTVSQALSADYLKAVREIERTNIPG
jgi:hypothetical protein